MLTRELQKTFLLAQCESMVLELDARLGDNNPWRSAALNEYDVDELATVKKLMHELLYAPPARVG